MLQAARQGGMGHGAVQLKLSVCLTAVNWRCRHFALPVLVAGHQAYEMRRRQGPPCLWFMLPIMFLLRYWPKVMGSYANRPSQNVPAQELAVQSGDFQCSNCPIWVGFGHSPLGLAAGITQVDWPAALGFRRAAAPATF